MTALKTYIVSAILAIVFNAQDTLWATPNHPFWYEGHYVEASALHAGDTIETLAGDYYRIQQIIPISGERRVYNITVAENSNYYVGSRGVLVHNDCFLKRLTDSPEIIARIDALPDALKGQFIQDFYEAGENVIKVLKERPGCVRAWEGLFKDGDLISDVLRKNTNALEWIAKNVDNIPNSVANDLLNNLNGRQITEVFEDAQKRLVVFTSPTGAGGATTVVSTLEKTQNGSYKSFKYGNAYSKVSPPVSANKLAPDFSSNLNGEWLYPISGNQKNIVEIELTGRRTNDYSAANSAAGFGKTPTGYTWHHLDDFNPETGKSTMQLVKSTEHVKSLPNSGSYKQYENYKSTTYLE